MTPEPAEIERVRRLLVERWEKFCDTYKQHCYTREQLLDAFGNEGLMCVRIAGDEMAKMLDGTSALWHDLSTFNRLRLMNLETKQAYAELWVFQAIGVALDDFIPATSSSSAARSDATT